MMSDCIASEHDAETGETVERVMTQEEIDAIMAASVAFMESMATEQIADEPMPFEPTEPNPLPEDGEL
jgi:hypothetical protein